MRVEIAVGEEGLVLDLALSERNVLALAAKLAQPGSARELHAYDVPAGFAYARVHIESDERHYNSATRRGAAPGPLSAQSERLVAELRRALEQT